MKRYDYVHQYTLKAIAKLESRIAAYYNRAKKEAAKAVAEWQRQFAEADKQHLDWLENGLIDGRDYRSWRQRAMARGESLRQLQQAVSRPYKTAYANSMKAINAQSAKVYAESRNRSAYEVETQSGASYADYASDAAAGRQRVTADLAEELRAYDEYTDRLIRNKATAAAISNTPSNDLSEAIANGIAAGLVAAAKAKASNKLMDCCNQGKMDAWNEQAEAGIQTRKYWLATLDDLTRPTHQDADGQERELDEPFSVGGYDMMEPRDSSMGAPSEETERCRCTCYERVVGLDREAFTRAARDKAGYSAASPYGWGESYQVPGNMSYADWRRMKEENGQWV